MKTIRAVVGVLRKKNNEILIAQRRKSQFMGGFWELPGGKIEAGETPEQALNRELNEELGVRVERLNLHQTINTPLGIEGQAIAWVKVADLNNYQLLPTMRAFINSITLPNKYWITPSNNHQSDEWMGKFKQKLKQDIHLIQLRSKNRLDSNFITELYNQCQQNNIKLLLNTTNKSFNETCDGWHLTSAEISKLNKRPCAKNKLLGASTHNLTEALKAQKVGADFVVISPIQATQTHPNTIPIGWNAAKEVVDKLNIPVYLLGGMAEKDLAKTLQLGAQGIAGVSAF